MKLSLSMFIFKFSIVFVGGMTTKVKLNKNMLISQHNFLMNDSKVKVTDKL